MQLPAVACMCVRFSVVCTATLVFGHTDLCFSACPLLKRNSDFLVSCLNPELLLAHFFVLSLDERGVWTTPMMTPKDE